VSTAAAGAGRLVDLRNEVVSNDGIASALPIDDTTIATWQPHTDVLSAGHVVVAREAVRVMKMAGRGGSIAFVGSRNALVASPGAAASCTAEAAALHLARCLAAERAPRGIRANVFGSDRSGTSTGNIINVDGGNVAAFTR
jgi:NAD(P)-dependent dehydrogenase (short-subunit alcohol dehydrogenase family)